MRFLIILPFTTVISFAEDTPKTIIAIQPLGEVNTVIDVVPSLNQRCVRAIEEAIRTIETATTQPELRTIKK